MLVVEQSQALVLKLNNPHRVLETIPTSRSTYANGVRLTGVPHKIDEVRVLHNLGISAPSPIKHYYDWPGRFTPYQHQMDTAAFLTLHNKCVVLNEIGCVDADTEYLSPTGWVRIADYKGGAVAQYWPEDDGDSNIDFVYNPEFVKLPCDTMLKVKTKHGLDQMLSPEHRVLLNSRSNCSKDETLTASELYDRHEKWLGGVPSERSRTKIAYSEAAIPTSFMASNKGSGIDISDEHLRVMVAVIADGYIPDSGKLCHVRLKKDAKKARLHKLLQDAGIQYKCVLCKPEGFHRFSFAPPMRTKVFGPWFWGALRRQLVVICDEVKHWDATIRANKPRIEFFSSEKLSADFIQYAHAACGFTARLTEFKRRGKTEYVVGISTKKRGFVQMLGTSQGRKRRAMDWVPSTDGFKYCFKVPSTYLLFRRNGCIFASGNTGKTQSALWAADYLMKVGNIKKVLILSPLSTLERVWGDAIFSEFIKRKHIVLHGAAARRKKLLKTDVDFYILNHDGFKVVYDELQDMFDLVIVDEAAVYRNPQSQRFKLFAKWMKQNPHTKLWLMTGTPTPNEPTDAWSLAKLVDSPHCPTRYTAFRDMVMFKYGPYKWLPRNNATETVQQTLQPAVRFTRDECFDLPDTVFQTREAALSAEQQKHYTAMFKSFVTDIEEDGQRITAVNEAVKLQKLVQIACGVAYDENKEHVELDCKPRLNLLREVISEAGEKVIVFVPLTGTLHMLEKELSKDFTTAVVNGEVSTNKRNEIFYNFQSTPDPHVLIAHPATMAHGLTLTAASTIVWYGPITSNEQYTQANGRIERIGKRHVSNVIHIESTKLERKMYDRLRNKQRVQGLLLDLIQAHQKEN